jgi:hypothetical protein
VEAEVTGQAVANRARADTLKIQFVMARRMMNIEEAITAHATWKMKLAKYLSFPDRSLNASVVGSPDLCELGKWIKDEGKQYSNRPEFTALVSGHNRFHKAAGEIVRKADAGEHITDEIALGSKSEFAAASAAIVKSIMAMKSKVAI